MTRVVGVHGIGQQQLGRAQLLEAWSPALADGLERAVGRNASEPALDLAYYGDLFLRSGETKGSNAGSEEIPEFDEELIDFFSEVEEEVVDEDPPDYATKGLKNIPTPLARLAGWLDHRFGLAGRILFFGDLSQVGAFQRDNDLASRVIDRVIESVSDDLRVLVGHSLGSVVAYEFACLDEGSVDVLITLGSPLALTSIQRQLRTIGTDGQPSFPNVSQWINVYDTTDPVACAGGLSPTWPAVVDATVDNGSDPHSVTRYLGKKETGTAILDALSD